PALVAGVLAGGFAALVLSVAGTRLGIEPGRAPLPATAVHARLLDRLLLAPAVAVIVTVLAVVVRAS
ncbi:MAG TPA: hypothetical protein VEA78_09230, partial [Acidimicrobiales bacterium]|nr:hypothetical protein [Acidimicrobiales bacterium]